MVGACYTEKGFDRTKADFFDPEHEACATCRFWLPCDRSMRAKDKTEELSFGFCRRRPPTIIDALVPMSTGYPVIGKHQDMEDLFDYSAAYDSTAFPGTYASEWCGEFEWLPDLTRYCGKGRRQ